MFVGAASAATWRRRLSMSSTETTEVPDLRQFEIVDHNIAAGYVTYIVDLWDGDRNDPTVSINRYIGTWRGENLEKEDGEAFDPSFWPKDRSRYTYRNRPSPDPLVWERLETVKEADQQLLRFKQDQENQLGDNSRYLYGGAQRRVELYQKFMDAIDVLAKRPDDEEAWKHVTRWRNFNARLHEK